MIRPGHMATGVIMRYRCDSKKRPCWSATIEFFDGGFADDDLPAGKLSTGGTIGSTFYVHEHGDMGHVEFVQQMVTLLLQDAESMNIEVKHPRFAPSVYVLEDDSYQDNGHPEVLSKDQVLAIFKELALRLNWEHCVLESTDDDDEPRN